MKNRAFWLYFFHIGIQNPTYKGRENNYFAFFFEVLMHLAQT